MKIHSEFLDMRTDGKDTPSCNFPLRTQLTRIFQWVVFNISGGRSVGIVRSRTQTMDVFFFVCLTFDILVRFRLVFRLKKKAYSTRSIIVIPVYRVRTQMVLR
jgi:hypothetical protein